VSSEEAILTAISKEFECGCETCANTAAICPATASSMVQEIAVLRSQLLRVSEEIEGHIDGAPDASVTSKLANSIFSIIAPR